MKHLILSYMEACNANDHAKGEVLLQQIRELGQQEHDSKH